MIVTYIHHSQIPVRKEEEDMPKMNAGNILKKLSQFTKLIMIQCLFKTN